MILTQFGKKVKVFQSYNAKEYLKSQFDDYLNTYGVIHQSSNTYTSNQNEVTDRKNFICLRLTSHVSENYWSYVVLRALYLINFMSPRVFN